MHNVELLHVMERDKYLNGESADEPFRDALEVVHLDELVQVHRQHLEGENEMLAENESLHDSHNILLILWIVLFELVEDTCLDQTLLIQPFLVS